MFKNLRIWPKLGILVASGDKEQSSEIATVSHSNCDRPTKIVSKQDIEEYVSLREIEDITPHWKYQIKLFLVNYFEYCEYNLTKERTLAYSNFIMQQYSRATYRKRLLQLRKYLRYRKLDWLDSVKIVAEPSYLPKRVTKQDIEACLRLFEGHLYEEQIRALITLGMYTGMRPSEIYSLKIEDIDLKNRCIRLQKTKTGIPRTVYFNEEAKEALLLYCRNKPKKLKYLFNQYHCMRLFRNANIQIKDLRKYFLQEWNRRNGNYLIGELVSGHSIRQNISLSHYVAFSEDEIKKEYDRIVP